MRSRRALSFLVAVMFILTATIVPGNITVAARKQLSVQASAPSGPTLNAPANAANGVSTSPTLSVGVSDTDGGALTVTFFGRPYASGNFTQIAQNTGVPSGSNSTTSWTSLGAGQRFEWYVTVSDGTSTTNGTTWTFNTTAATDPVFVGAGDIADCTRTQDEATAAIVTGVQGAVWTAGDNAYQSGTSTEFTNCYEPSWGGAIKARTRPIPGNHDWATGNLNGYNGYFGAAATDGNGKSYYSYNIGSNWHVVNLDTECASITGGCAAGSPQELWLRADLTANSTRNVVAIWHKPRFSSSTTNLTDLQPFYTDLYEFGVDLLLQGHDHVYERTAPMNASGAADATYGVRQFTVGTGGAGASGFGSILATSQARNAGYGVLKLTLHATTYDWAFLPIAGSTFTDTGSGNVHAAPPDSNAAPVAAADSYSTATNTAKVQAAPGVLANDTDADSDPLTAVLVSNVTHGTLSLNANGGFTYTPTAGYSGADTFTYKANDGTADSNVATVSLTIGGSGAAFQPLVPLAASASTSDKPQSKLWQYGGSWWMVAPSSSASPSGTWIWKLGADLTWAPALRLSSRTDTHGDVRAIGDVSHILLYGSSPELYSVHFNTSTNTYEPWSSRPTATPISLPNSETATIDVDSTGEMWLATESGSSLNVYHSPSPYTAFSGPISLASNINDDDIGVVTALPGKVGVLWSNQATRRFGFKVHVDGAAANSWSADEVPASQSADDSLGAAFGMADDHLNVAVSSDGTLYAAVKTSYDNAAYPKIALLIRRPNGTWDDLYEVDRAGTRGLVVINEAANLLRIIYTSAEGFNPIVYKQTALSSINFGARQTLMTSSFNDVSSTKQNWTDSLVVVASNSSNSIGGVIFGSPGSSNADPVAVADSYTTAPDTALVQSAPGVLANDTDADADALTAVLVSDVSHGTLSLNANGGFTYTPTAGYS
ncbi:MAG TPA: Ig-like domain-containing protein, partial [Mycobacterium sp.]|nr:Ig-like domain-containing protein [Mycobacterium sp.]